MRCKITEEAGSILIPLANVQAVFANYNDSTPSVIYAVSTNTENEPKPERYICYSPDKTNPKLEDCIVEV